MDLNYINLRLKTIYSSMKTRINPDIENNINIEITNIPNTVLFSVGKKDKYDNFNIIYTIISNIADLKDILIRDFEKQGKEKNIVEHFLNSSDFLKIILDLNNAKKHGYPLTKTKRSMKDPQITNIREGITIKPGETKGIIDFSIKPFGEGGKITNHQNIVISINADIIDIDGKHLFDLNELIDGALKDRENFIIFHNL